MSEPTVTIPERPVIRVTGPTYTQLLELVNAKTARTGRQVTFSEVIEDLLAKRGTA